MVYVDFNLCADQACAAIQNTSAKCLKLKVKLYNEGLVVKHIVQNFQRINKNVKTLLLVLLLLNFTENTKKACHDL